MSDYRHLKDELTLAAPADRGQVERLRQDFGPQVPDDYLEFLTAHDGAEGAVGVIVPAAEVGRADDLHPELDHLHGLLIFGSDGGLEAFAFDQTGAVGRGTTIRTRVVSAALPQRSSRSLRAHVEQPAIGQLRADPPEKHVARVRFVAERNRRALRRALAHENDPRPCSSWLVGAPLLAPGIQRGSAGVSFRRTGRRHSRRSRGRA
jgi:hypothetical protein